MGVDGLQAGDSCVSYWYESTKPARVAELGGGSETRPYRFKNIGNFSFPDCDVRQRLSLDDCHPAADLQIEDLIQCLRVDGLGQVAIQAGR